MKMFNRCTGAARMRGMTLIELMVAMVLGLVVIGGATSAIVASRESYRTNEALSQVQESARTAFELLARDLREAGVTGCDSSGRMANVLDSSAPTWWQTWYGIAGYDGAEADGAVGFGTAVAQRIAGTDSVLLQGTEDAGVTIETHFPTSANFKINAPTTTIADDDILIVCDFDHAAMFRATNYNSANVTVGHNTGGNGTPENCSKGLGYPTDCSSVNGNAYAFGPNARLARMVAVDWYIGSNGREAEGGRSLYRHRLGAASVPITEEVVAGVTDMQLTYREEGSEIFREAALIANWTNVHAVMVELTLRSGDQRVSTDTSVNSGRLQRTFTNVIALRNRVP